MICFTETQSLSDLTSTNEFHHMSSSIRGYALISQIKKGSIDFFIFESKKSLKFIYNFQTKDKISTAGLSNDRRILYFKNEKNIHYFVDLETTTEPLILKKVKAVKHLKSCERKELYMYLKERTLYLFPIYLEDCLKTRSRETKSICDNVVWWKYDDILNYLVVLTNTRKLIYYKFQEESFIELFIYQIDQGNDFLPTHLFPINYDSFILASISHSFVSFMSFPSGRFVNFHFQSTFNYSYLTLFHLKNNLIISAPPVSLMFIDFDTFWHHSISDKSFLKFETPAGLENCSNDSSLFFSSENFKFYTVSFDWLKLVNLFDSNENSKFVGHLLGLYKLNCENELFLEAQKRCNQFVLFNFICEYIISKAHTVLSKSFPNLLMKFLAFTFKDSISINDGILAESNILNIVQPKIQFIIEDCNKSDESYTPLGFWKFSTILYILYFHIANNITNSKLPLEFFDSKMCLLSFYSPSNSEKKILKDYSSYYLSTFLSKIYQTYTTISDNIVLSPDEVTYLKTLLIYFNITKELHIPFNVIKTYTLQTLVLKYFPKFLIYYLTKLNIIQFPEMAKLEEKYEIDLWLRSQNKFKLSDKITSKFINWPTIIQLDSESNLLESITGDNSFTPYAFYSSAFLSSNHLEQNKKRQFCKSNLEQSYSLNNLLEIYSDCK